MDNLLQSDLLDLAANNAEAGYRLERLEVYNWGTFNKHVWLIEPKNKNALLTGDIGSGKSTLVDAITTLLVPHQRIVYNKAAGAESKERNLYTYIRGEYNNKKDDFTQSAKAIALRDENNYTVLLSYFYNSGFSQGITLAQVFWLKDNKRNPEKFFVIAQKRLTIATHFSGFESDILNLKKLLRKDEAIELFDSFKDYSTRFRQHFGIHNEQALELFYQTVSMKSVGNLTEFVRNHMLEKCDIEQRVSELRNNFDNLNRAHEAVLKAKNQVELLKPLVENAIRYEKLGETIKELRDCRDLLYPYFAIQEVILLKDYIAQLEVDIEKDQQKLDLQKREIKNLHIQESDIRKNIDNNGGQRLQVLEQEIMRLDHERGRKQELAVQYQQFLEKLKLKPILNENDFDTHLKFTRILLEKFDENEKSLQIKKVDISINIQEIRSKEQEIIDELESLKKRQSNIPAQMLMLRQNITSALDQDENSLPYVGELLQIDEEAKEWEGVIERVLHNFGLSLLVPEQLYPEVNYYVERTQLKGRLVYFRTKLDKSSLVYSQIEAESLINKLHIKPDCYFSPWIENELHKYFNYICCKDIDAFRHLTQAITPNGLIKSRGQRHEKDDRHILHDRSRYILGWSNQQKIIALNTKLNDLRHRGLKFVEDLSELDKQQKKLLEERDACRDLLKITSFADIYWQASVLQIQVLSEEKQQIEKSSNILKTLRDQLEKTQQMIEVKLEKQAELQGNLGRKEQQMIDRKDALDKAEVTAKQIITPTLLEKLEQFKQEILDNSKTHAITLHNVGRLQIDTRTHITRQIDNYQKQYERLTGNITQQMQLYKNEYPAETLEVDATPEATPEYMRMLTQLENEDLPRHEKRFKALLNEGTINSIALFQHQLNREKQDIEDRIHKINLSLGGIEYNTGTYIEMQIDNAQDVDIRNFQQDIRRCLQNTLNDKDFYDEDKFLQIKALIERFNGRGGVVDMDYRWTQKVCDVRNWFNFSASERWVENNSEKEFFSDASGKSGGQKEKLAYTILASSLAYQFGLERGGTQSRSFRFVVIDEAFGKGSDESTRYGLELFKKLNLQLLIVTPLQKIRVIEDYVHSVNCVQNPDGCDSVIRNLTIEEYHEEKRTFNEEVNDLTSAD